MWQQCVNSHIDIVIYILKFHWSMSLVQWLRWSWSLDGVFIFYSFLSPLNMEIHKDRVFEIFQMCPLLIHQQRKYVYFND